MIPKMVWMIDMNIFMIKNKSDRVVKIAYKFLIFNFLGYLGYLYDIYSLIIETYKIFNVLINRFIHME